jgi:hypothetical protein
MSSHDPSVNEDVEVTLKRSDVVSRTAAWLRERSRQLTLVLTVVAALVAFPAAVFASSAAFIAPFNTVSGVASTVPPNGDVNPYGVVLVPASVGDLVQGRVLVSNFNNSSNLQGTGTTIVQIAPGGKFGTFATIDPSTLPGPCPGGVGLTGGLAVLQRGWVVVGSLPTTDGTSATAQAGCLIVLNSTGQVVETIAGSFVNGPWGMTVQDNGSTASLFVSNVLNDTVAGNGQVVKKGTIIRINLKVPNQGFGKPQLGTTTIIGSGFSERTDPAALVIGPQGLALANGTLYIADSLNNRIAAIPNAVKRGTSAMTGATISVGHFLNDPLGVTIAPNGDILTTNGNDGRLVETTPQGVQLAQKLVDRTGSPPGSGCLFDLVPNTTGNGVYFADDCSNTLDLLH